jgi:predicted dehydrogenase
MKPSLWLIGSGKMAQDYAKVLIFLNKSFKVIGRGRKSAISFQKATGIDVQIGGLKSNITKTNFPKIAIVTVGVEQLAKTAKHLLNAGVKHILLEKPGALNLKEISSLNFLANKKKAKVFIGYNRRFYESVKIMKQIIKKDGGISAVNFEFTEWASSIKSTKINFNTKKNWFIANSSHVIDLAFHLCGKPKNWKCWHAGSLDWHPASSRYCGSGLTDKGIMFSYISNWEAPGRWSLELMTKKHRFILRPMEKLQAINLNNIVIKNIILKDKFDKKFKPGLYHQTINFLKKKNHLLCTLSEQVKNIKIYSKMAGY